MEKYFKPEESYLQQYPSSKEKWGREDDSYITLSHQKN